MNLQQLIARVRMNATIEDGHQDYTDEWIAAEINDAVSPKLSEMIMEAKSGYWLQYSDFTTTTGQYLIRIPPRALILSKIEICNGFTNGGAFQRLPEVFEGHADIFSAPPASLGYPTAYALRGDTIWFMKPCDNSGYTVRVWYYVRPSIIVSPQNRGVVTAVDIPNRTFEINFIPYDKSTTPQAYITEDTTIDIVHSNGWHELSVVDATFEFDSAAVIIVQGTQSVDRVVLGDVVRASGQSDWPPIPDDYHRMLADIVSAKILAQLDNAAKAGPIFQDGASDMARFGRLISDRALEEPRTLRPMWGGYNRRGGNW